MLPASRSKRIALGLALAGLLIWLLSLVRISALLAELPRVMRARLNPDVMLLGWLLIIAAVYLYGRAGVIETRPAPKRGLNARVCMALIAIILLGAFLRLYHLDYQSMWFDELASAGRARDALLGTALIDGGLQDAWPSYHIPLYLFVRLAGDSEFVLRLGSALAGILLIPAVFVLGRRMFSARVGLTAALFAAVMRTPVWYSQEVRAYALLATLAAVSSYLWLRIAQDIYWRDKTRPWRLVMYVGAAILTVYCHYFGLLLVLTQSLLSLLIALWLRRLPAQWAAAYAAIGAAYLPWVPVLIGGLNEGAFWAPRPQDGLTELSATVLFMFHDPGQYGDGGIPYLSALFESPVVMLTVLIAGLGIVAWGWKRLRRTPSAGVPLLLSPAVILAGWLLIPFLITYFRSALATPSLVYRYLLIDAAPACLLFAAAIFALPLNRNIKIWIGVVLAAIFLAWSVGPGAYYTAPHKVEYRGAVAYIARQMDGDTDFMVVGAQTGDSKYMSYYFEKDGLPSAIDVRAGFVSQSERVMRRLGERGPRTIWFIGEVTEYEMPFVDFLAGRYTLKSRRDFYEVSVWRFEDRAGAAPP